MSVPDLLNELGIDYAEPGSHHHVSQGWYGVDCPRCSPGWKRYRAGIPEDGRVVNCWICGALPLAETLSEMADMPLNRIYAMLSDFGLLGVSEYSPRPENGSGERIERKKAVLPSGLSPLQRAHRRYLERRKLKPTIIERLWEVRGIGIAPALSWRLFIPIRQGSETVSWTTRSISDDSDQRYISARPDQEKVHLREVLYGEELARHAIVICEGPIDAWSIGPGATAILGTSPSQSQMLAMSKYPVRAVCFDAEKDAQRRAKDLCKMLEVFEGDTFNVRLETGKDANEASRKEIKELRRRFLT